MASAARAPLVTVVINAHNGARYLGEAIESVYAQSLQDFEIVLFDDASTDATPEIARGFDERLRYFRSERLIPLGEARNQALELSRGTYVSFLDQDDLYLPRKLERQVVAFRGNVGLVFSNSIRFWEASGREALLYRSRPPDGNAFRALLSRYYLHINTVMIRRGALSEDRAWWFPPDFRMYEEADLFLRLAFRHPIAYVDEPLAKYRIHGGNFSLRHREFIAPETRAMLARLSHLIPKFDALYAREIAGLQAEALRAEAQIHWKEGRRGQAWTSYRNALRLFPRAVYLAEILLSAVTPFETWIAVRERIGKPM